ncbi:hypothetical protein NIES4071_54440 [Calothrix sp. NIES-4071]|nr:hypothetical protein NIES4071_54440 [Calothrix sp. NIES-4071]BAZ59752.1 hypothetical protein NIES4105_54390 [Calothrix sp. NIES-4105]
MSRLLHLSSFILSIWLMGCSASTTAKTPITALTSDKMEVAQNTNKGQQLPITAVAVLPSGVKIELEVAKTPEQQQMGLMYRPALPDNRGMLFDFREAQPVSFWMKNVPVKLDMVFMHKGVVEYITASAPPCTTESCPTYGPNKLIDQVIELRAGRAGELKLKVGDRVDIRSIGRSIEPSASSPAR